MSFVVEFLGLFCVNSKLMNLVLVRLSLVIIFLLVWLNSIPIGVCFVQLIHIECLFKPLQQVHLIIGQQCQLVNLVF